MNKYFKYSKRLLQMFVATRYATQIRSSSNVCRYSICDLEKVEFKCFEVLFERTEPLLALGEEMEIGHFYYIDDQYFKDFPDSYWCQNINSTSQSESFSFRRLVIQ